MRIYSYLRIPSCLYWNTEQTQFISMFPCLLTILFSFNFLHLHWYSNTRVPLSLVWFILQITTVALRIRTKLLSGTQTSFHYLYTNAVSLSHVHQGYILPYMYLQWHLDFSINPEVKLFTFQFMSFFSTCLLFPPLSFPFISLIHIHM